MKMLNFKTVIFTGILLLISIVSIEAQNIQQRPPKDNFRPQQILRELGLSKEQIKQIRQINQEREPKMRAAQDNLRDTNRSLDLAIYADTLNEEEIQTKLKDVQTAQAEVIKIRNMTELAVRKVLTAEQLTKFRGLRDEFMRRLEERRIDDRNDNPPQERDDNPNPPLNDRPLQQQQIRPNF
jgi:Spy/CpxP family protein refolding chaperone